MKALEVMNLLDDFLFYTMVNYPGIGEEFSREILSTIFNRKFGRLKVMPQKVYYGLDVGYHGARLDVVLDEDISEIEKGGVYDLEPEQKEKDVKDLPKRVRFYHAMIDAKSLKTGEKYKNLKRVVVIMIMPFDPFGFNHMIYTIKNHCVELPHMEYDDGAMTLFLYTKGTKGNVPRELKELLVYMEHTTKENACNAQLEKIHRMVEVVKKDSEVSLEYMKIFEKEEMIREEAEEAGRQEGRQEGTIKTLKSLIEKGRLTIQEAAFELGMTESEFVECLNNSK